MQPDTKKSQTFWLIDIIPVAILFLVSATMLSFSIEFYMKGLRLHVGLLLIFLNSMGFLIINKCTSVPFKIVYAENVGIIHVRGFSSFTYEKSEAFTILMVLSKKMSKSITLYVTRANEASIFMIPTTSLSQEDQEKIIGQTSKSTRYSSTIERYNIFKHLAEKNALLTVFILAVTFVRVNRFDANALVYSFVIYLCSTFLCFSVHLFEISTSAVLKSENFKHISPYKNDANNVE